eukprot:CAMPEP_0116872700 /NCGR_PEP_ID=MMETSP0463-20121206/3527_1 /TAXON_ID=181622 /ORGANISM="Strombidinopsis sp, Strain SopsisLIS2011" /LENGTH=69 /DNA_ID=CAMNT_0004513337 /DNA_START=458 /DNA_END=667 /DNA_ORIENTATION=+
MMSSSKDDDNSQDILLGKKSTNRVKTEGLMDIGDFMNNDDSLENEVSNLDLSDEFGPMNIKSQHKIQDT